MNRRYQQSLDDHLEEVAFSRIAVIPKWKLTKWYEQDNFTVNIRREIRKRWAELLESLEWKQTCLRFAEIGDDIYLMRQKDFYNDKE